MKTLYEVLNNTSNETLDEKKSYPWDDIALAISDNDLKNILEGYPKYANKVYPNLKIFYDPSYISPELTELKKEGIIIKEEQLPDNIILSKNINKLKDTFKKSIYEYANESIRDVIDYSKISQFSEENIDKFIDKYILEYFINYFNLSFINKDKQSDEYIICDIDGVNIFYFEYIYNVYKFGSTNSISNIKNNDPVSKEHLIEYCKQATEFVSKSSHKDTKIYLYSGYFDDL